MVKEWFSKNISQPISRLFHKYILRDVEQNDVQDMVTDIAYYEETQSSADDNII